MIIVDNLAGLALNAVTGSVKNKIDDIKLRNDLIKFIERQKKYNEVCSMAEEFDFQGLIEYISDNLISDVKQRFFSAKRKERAAAQEAIVNAAVEYSKAKTDVARKRVARLVSMCLEMIRDVFKKKISIEHYYLAAEVVDAVKENTDETIESVKAELRQDISDSTSAIMEKLVSMETLILPDSNFSKEEDNELVTLQQRANEEGLRVVDANTVQELSEEDLKDFPEASLQYMRDALGRNAIGLNKVQMMTRFLNMTDAILQNDMRYDLPEYVFDLPRSRSKAYLYVDVQTEPVDFGFVNEFYWNEYDKFTYKSAHVRVEILYREDKLLDFSIGFEVVDKYAIDRLNAFETVKQILTADSIKMVLEDAFHRVFEIPTGDPKEMWVGKASALLLCKFWCSRIQEIREIEKFYDIVFEMEKLTGEDNIKKLYEAVNYVYNGVKLQPNCEISLPGGCKEDVEITEPMLLEEIDDMPLPSKVIHNVSFKPYQSWFVPGTLHWKGTTKEDIVQIQGCCRYKINNENSSQIENIKIISAEIEKYEFADMEIEEIGQDDDEFIRHYMGFLCSTEEIWQRFLQYKEKLDQFMHMALNKDQQYEEIKTENNGAGKTAINRMVNSAVSAGEILIEKIDCFIKDMKLEKDLTEGTFSAKWAGDSLGYYFLRLMKRFSYFGYFPVHWDDETGGYYDFNEIEHIAQNIDDSNIIDIIELFKEIFADSEINLNQIDLYNMMWNFRYAISLINKKYYEVLLPEIENAVGHMSEILSDHTNLIHQDGRFSNNIVYKFNDNYYVCSLKDGEDILRDCYGYKDVADEELENCLLTCRNRMAFEYHTESEG